MSTASAITSVTTATSALISGTTGSNALAMISVIDTALETINSERSRYGAMQNRFEAIIRNLQLASENQSAARSRIMDADFAAETAALTRAQILQQAGMAMLSQANRIPLQVLQLLKS